MRFTANRRAPLVPWLAIITTFAGIAVTSVRANAPVTLDIDLSRPGVSSPSSLSGLMTEEITHAHDGGLFAELIQNRTFQDPGPTGDGIPVHWSVVGSGKASTDPAKPVNATLPISIRLDLAGGEAGVANDGYWGIPVRPDTPYTASFYARAGGGFAGPVTASLRTDDAIVMVARADTPPISTR